MSVLLVCALSCAHAPARTAAPSPRGIETWTLANGLKVLFLADHNAPVVSVQVWYRSGSRNERPGIRGIAHLFEHMMFKGSENYGPEEHARLIDEAGGRENAFTAEDMTAYHDTLPAEGLDLALRLEAERMWKLRLTQESLDSEREVVKEEYRLRLENNPIMVTFDKFRSIAYTEHPYSWTALGFMDDLDRITVADCQAFYEAHYSPGNAVLIVVGDTRADELKRLVDLYFSPIPARPLPPPVTAVEPAQLEFRHEVVRTVTQVPIIIGGYKIPAAGDPDIPVLKVIQKIIAAGQSSRLYQRLVREQQIAVGAGGHAMAMRDPGLMLIWAAFLPGKDPAAVEEALIAEFEALGHDLVDEEEVAKARNQLTANYTFGLLSVAGRADQIGMAEVVQGDYRRFLEGPSRYERVTAMDVQRVAKACFKRTNLTIALLLPPEGGGMTAAE